jgi:hypothetical protein
MALGYAIVAKNSESDATTDYVYSNDGTFLPVGADIPNPLWVDDGSQTTPDTNGADRYLPFDASNWDNAEPFLDDFFPIETIRQRKSEVQSANLEFNIELQRIETTISPV